MPRTATLLRRALGGSPTDLAQLIGTLPNPPSSARCANPECKKMCTWDGKGRPRRFCGDACRGTFNRTRKLLMDERDAYEEALRTDGLPVATKNLVNNRVAALEMQLDQYRPFSSDAQGS